MNFLSLCRRAYVESGLSGPGPATVVSQTGATDRVIKFVEREWRRIQGLHDGWLFMRASASLSLVAGTREYAGSSFAADFDLPYTDTLKYQDRTGFIRYVEWQDWVRGNYDLSASVQSGKPCAFTWSPDLKIIFDRDPDAAYPVQLEYHRTPQSLAADSDVPIIPERFHDIIIYAAIVRFAQFDKDPELMQTATMNYEEWLAKLENSQLPKLKFANSRYAS